jgi:hypothetical protein
MLRDEIKELVREILIEELTSKEDLEEATKKSDPMYGPEYYIVVSECAGDSSYVQFMGNDMNKAGKEFRSLVRDFDRYGMGGGDTTIIFYEFTGRPMVFRDVYTKWLSKKSLEYNRDLTELGFDLDDLLELDEYYC